MAAEVPIAWNFTDPAPQDRWILVDLDDGSQDCAEEPGTATHLARWNPTYYVGLGNYEWLVLRYGDFEHWSDGRIMQWAELPDSPSLP